MSEDPAPYRVKPSPTQSERDLENVVRQIADETGARPETLRLALQGLKAEGAEAGLIANLRRQWSRMNSSTKRIASSAFLGLQAAAAQALADRFGDRYGLLAIAQIVLIAIAIFNLALVKRREVGFIAGAAFGFAGVFGRGFFSMLLRAPVHLEGGLVIPFTFGAALLGLLISQFSGRISKLRFQHDPEKRREELLKQLIELQDELKQTEKVVTFLSVDVAGSTRIKGAVDGFISEYTFGEYTNFVVTCANQFGGTLHSTAGDGVLLTFEHPNDAFQAARRIQVGMLEFNAYRNKTGQPFALRCGIHTGAVMTAGKDLRSVAYSHVLDIASHVQRAAPVGSVAVTEDAAIFLPGGSASVGTDTVEAQGVRAYVWYAPALAPAAPAIGAPPPPPVASR